MCTTVKLGAARPYKVQFQYTNDLQVPIKYVSTVLHHPVYLKGKNPKKYTYVLQALIQNIILYIKHTTGIHHPDKMILYTLQNLSKVHQCKICYKPLLDYVKHCHTPSCILWKSPIKYTYVLQDSIQYTCPTNTVLAKTKSAS